MFPSLTTDQQTQVVEEVLCFAEGGVSLNGRSPTRLQLKKAGVGTCSMHTDS